jgi:hypothetical protein
MSLNPRENRTLREAKKERRDSKPPPSLEPAFPYTKVYFDPFVFEGITLDPKNMTAAEAATEAAKRLT